MEHVQIKNASDFSFLHFFGIHQKNIAICTTKKYLINKTQRLEERQNECTRKQKLNEHSCTYLVVVFTPKLTQSHPQVQSG